MQFDAIAIGTGGLAHLSFHLLSGGGGGGGGGWCGSSISPAPYVSAESSLDIKLRLLTSPL